MKVLKFGGTSVGSAQSISTVIDILKQEDTSKGSPVVVLSAMSGVTNLLALMAEDAAVGKDFTRHLAELEARHFSVVKELLDIQQQNPVLTRLKLYFNQLEDLLQGVLTLQELTPKTRDMIMSYGTSQFNEYKKEVTHYRFFEDPIDNGKDAVFGLDVHLMKLVNFLRSASLGYGTEKRVLLLHGPVGSAKSTIARLLLRLIEPDAGAIRFEDEDWLALGGAALRARRAHMQMVFQDPLAAFNPRATIARVLDDPLRIHGIAARAEIPLDARPVSFEFLWVAGGDRHNLRVPGPPGSLEVRHAHEADADDPDPNAHCCLSR